MRLYKSIKIFWEFHVKMIELSEVSLKKFGWFWRNFVKILNKCFESFQWKLMAILKGECARSPIIYSFPNSELRNLKVILSPLWYATGGEPSVEFKAVLRYYFECYPVVARQFFWRELLVFLYFWMIGNILRRVNLYVRGVSPLPDLWHFLERLHNPKNVLF